MNKVVRTALCLFALLGTVLAGLYFCKGPVVAWLAHRYLLPGLERQGVSLAFDGLDTDLFSSLTLSGVSLHTEIPSIAKISGNIDRATLHYKPAELWSNFFHGLAASSLEIEGAHIQYKVEGHENEGQGQENFFDVSLPGLPYGIPSLSFRKSSLAIEATSWNISLTGLSASRLTTTFDGGQGGLAGSLHLEEIRERGLPFFAVGRQVEVDAVYRSGRITIASLFVEGRKLLENTQIATSANGIQTAGTMQLAGGIVDFKLDGSGAELQGTIKSRDLKLADLDSSLVPQPDVLGTLSLQSSFNLDLVHPDASSAALLLRMEKGKVAGLSVDSLDAELTLDKGTIAGKRIEIKAMANRASMRGIRANLADLLHGNYWSAIRNGAAEFNLSLENWRQFENVIPREVSKAFSDIQCRRLHLEGGLDNASLKFYSFDLQGQAFDAVSRNGTIRLPAAIKDWTVAKVEAEVAFTLQKMTPLHSYLPTNLQEIEGKVRGSAKLSGKLADLDGRLSLAGEKIKYRSMPGFGFLAEAEIVKGSVQVTDLLVRAGEDRIEAKGLMPLKPAENFDLRAEGRIKDFSEYAGLLLAQTEEVAGDLSFSFAAQGTINAPEVSADLHSSRLAIAGQVLENVTLSMAYDGVQASVSALRFNKGDADFRFSGRLEPGPFGWRTVSGSADTFIVSGPAHRLQLIDPAWITYEEETLSFVEPVRLDSDLGPVTVSGSAGLSRLALKVEADSLRLPAEPKAPGGNDLSFDKASLSLTVNGSPVSPVVVGHGLVRRLRDPDLAAAFDGDIDFSYDDSGLELSSLELDGGQAGKVSLHGHLPVVFRQGELRPLDTPLALAATVVLPDAALLHLLFPEYIEKAESMEGDVRLTGTLQKPLGFASLKAHGLLPSAAGIDWLPPGVLSVDLRLRAEENRLGIEMFRIESQEYDIDIGGQVNGNMLLADLLRFDHPQLAADLQLHGSLRLPGLAWVAERFSAIRRLDGRLAGDFSLQGPLQHPVVKADLLLNDGELRSSMDLPVLRELTGKISVDRDGITLPSLTGFIGGSKATASGRIIFEQQKEPAFDLKVTGKNLLLYRSDGVKIRGDADFALKGSLNAPIIEGKLLLTDGYYAKNIHLLKMMTAGMTSSANLSSTRFSLFSFSDEPLKDTKFSISIQSAAAFTVNTNLLKGELRPDLLLTGTGELPQLIGEIYVDDAKCNLPAGPLVFDSGLLRFRQTEPDRFFLELSGSAKMLGYDITVKIDGPYDAPTIALSSYPPLANEDLLLLLLTGQRPASGFADSASRTDMSRVAVYLGRELLTSLFGKEYTDEQSMLDRLRLDIGRNITRQGDDTIEARFLLKEGVLRKNDALYLTAEKDVWDDYNSGVRLIFRFK